MKVYRVALQMVGEVHTAVLPKVRVGGDREIADQLHRASRSVALNVAEGLGLLPGKRQRNHFAIALGSARETMACIDIAVATGLVSSESVAPIADRVDHVCAMLWKLTRRSAA
ncbi:MAG: four helix bundle protein [Deltaproteobacteria bacterium]|nr:four helix bundle protein [Deltaproteobacteria bacterium]